MNSFKSNVSAIGCILVILSLPVWAVSLPFGQTQTGTISSAAQSNSYTFSANANDVVDFTIVATSGNLSPKIGLYTSGGNLLASASNTGFGGCTGAPTTEMNTVVLAATGTYTVLVGDCGDTNTGNYQIYAQRTNNPSGAATLSLGQTPVGTIASAAQSNSYTFSGNAKDVVDLTAVATTGNLSPKLRLYNPDGMQLSSAANTGFGGCTGAAALEMNVIALPANGTYTVLVGDCGDKNTGNYAIYAQRTNNPTSPNALFWGQVEAGKIASAAQSDSYNFSGTANDVVNLTMVTTSGTLSPKLRLYNPDGTQLSTASDTGFGGCTGASTTELDGTKLPATGNYTLLVGDCGDTNTGNYNLSAQCFGVCAVPVVTLLPQTITFGPLANQVLGAAPFEIGATTTSNLTVTFASNTTSVCTVSGVIVTLVAVGTCSVTASQPGNSTYAAATPVTQTFTVNAATGRSSKSIVLLTRTSDDATVDYFSNLLTTAGLPFTRLTAAQVNASNVANSILIAGFSAQPTEFQGAASVIGNAVNNGSWLICEAYGAYLPVYAGIGSVSMTSTDPVVLDHHAYVTGSGAIFNGIPTWDPPNPPDEPAQYTEYYLQTSVYGIVNYAPPSGADTINYWNLTLTYGWDGQSTDSTYCQSWGGCTGDRSVAQYSLYLIPVGNGEIFVGPDGIGVIAGYTQYGPALDKIHLNAIQLAGVPVSETPPPATCAFALAPASQVFPAAAGMGAVGVLTSAGCPWTASTSASFLSITSGLSGAGPGVIEFSATANSDAAARAGTITVAGQTATINQAGTAPLLLLSPTSIAVHWRQQGPLPTAIPLSVFTATSSLSYTAAASSTGNWLAVSPASGSAPATIIVTVNPSSLQPGTYQGTVSVTAPTANPSSQSFSVSLTVVAAGSPTLSLTTTSLNYAFAQGAQQVRQQRIPVGNSGGGTLSYNASASTNSGANWLSVSQDAAGATLSTPDLLTVTIDPSGLGVGTYTGLITITADTTQNIPVTVTVSAVQQTILLSQTGLTFTAVANGGIVPPQTFGILNSGTGSMDWSVSSSTVTGGNAWLSVTPNSGTTDASSLTVPLATVYVSPANLAPGQYSGQIQVTSSAADNTPQFVSVILNILPAGSDPGPVVLPTGSIFTEAVGGTPAGSQQIALANLTGSQLTFATGTLTNDGANWLSVTPAAGTATPTQETILTVSVSSAGLSPGIRQGVLTLLFQDGSVRTVNILYLLATGGISSNTASVSHPLATTGSCTPTKLLPLVTSFGSQFTVPAGWPNTLAAQVVDDCGNPHVSGTVIATFSNGDPPLPLISLKNGNWTGTWQVTNASASVIAITVNADNPSLNISGSFSVSGSLQSSANAPVIAAGGVLNAASYSLSAPLAPGTMVSIFGANLANGTSAASALPLSTQLSGTLVIIGGEPAPLLYAGQGQINAIIPYGLPVNTNTQVIVQQGNAYTSPQAITLSAAAPAIFTKSGEGTGQGVIIRPDGQYAEPGTPAQAGDEIVLYAVGLGETTPLATAGLAATSSPLLWAAAPVSLTIGGQNARVDFAGLAPGFAELYQINAAVPAGVKGDSVPVVLTAAGQPSPTVTMAVQ